MCLAGIAAVVLLAGLGTGTPERSHQGNLAVDGVVDLDDFAVLADCLNGPGESTLPSTCAHDQFSQADRDGDSDVDLHDFWQMQMTFTGPPCRWHSDCIAPNIWSEPFCRKADGDCLGWGTCYGIDYWICLDWWVPVCGCDRMTHNSHCYAQRNGVNVAYWGVCQ
jgi:hypothetical protein